MDYVAASIAASRGLSPNGDEQKDPLQTLKEQINITLATTGFRILTKMKQFKNMIKRGEAVQHILRFVKNLTYSILRRNNTKNKPQAPKMEPPLLA